MRLTEFEYEHLGRRVRLRFNVEPYPMLVDITGRLCLTLLVGANGSGKTSVLSSLVRLFHHADWRQERILSPARAQYRLPGHSRAFSLNFDGRSVLLEHDAASTTIADTGRPRNPREDPGLLPLLPTVVASVFSTRGEYPSRKVGNARGLRHTAIYDISKLYGKHHYELGSFSAGLRKFVSEEFASARDGLRDITGLTATGHVSVFPSRQLRDAANFRRGAEDAFFMDADWRLTPRQWKRLQRIVPWLQPGWIPVTEEVLAAEKRGDIYINDVLILDPLQQERSLMTLSAGQKMLLVRLLSILSSINDGTLVIFEEPELHLDPLWCAGLVQLLGRFFGRYDAHFIITTQNLSVVRCFPSQALILMSNGQPLEVRDKIFLASEAVVADVLYRGGSPLGSLEDLVLDRLHSFDGANRQAALRTLGEGPLRFLARHRIFPQDPGES